MTSAPGDSIDTVLRSDHAAIKRALADLRANRDPDRTGDVRAVGSRMAMDRAMVEPARFTAASFAAQGLPAYEYRFSYVATSMRGQWPGAPHATEIPYVFDTVRAKYGKDLTEQDEAIARAANAYWANFARTGDPNGPGLPPWPRFTGTDSRVMRLKTDPRAGALPGWNRLELIDEMVNHFH